MKKFAIVTDSTTYLKEEEFEKFGIKRASLNIIKQEETFRELDLDNQFVIDTFAEGISLSTSQPSPGEYLGIYEELLAEGYEKIFVLVISEHLSGTYQSALLAKKMLDDSEKIHLFKSNMAAFGNEMLILELIEMIHSGKTYETIVARIDSLIETTGLLISVEDLTAVIRSGRLSKAKAMVGKFLRVKPIIQMVDGKLDLYKAARTTKKVLAAMIDDMDGKITDFKKLFVRIISHNSPEAAEILKNTVKERFKNLEVTVTDYIGPVFNVHVGRKGYGISWMFE